MEVQRRVPGDVSKANLTARAVDLLMHACVSGGAPGVVRDLPIIIPGRSNFEQELLIFAKRQILADAPV